MAKRNTIIRINGKQYDAITGLAIADAKSVKTPTAAPVNAVKAAKPVKKSIDGVVGGTVKKQVATPVSQPTTTQTKPAKPLTVRTPAQHAKARSVTPSKTLMRHAVSKPKASVKRHAKVHTATHHASHLAHRPAQSIVVKQSVYSVSEHRLARAQSIGMSPRIARFAHQVATSAPAVTVENALTAINKAIIIPETPSPQHIVYRPDVSRVRSQKQNTSDVFEQALLRATSHEETAPELTPRQRRSAIRSLRHRMVSYTAGAMAVLAIAGFFGFQNSASQQFKRATSSANFSVSMPAYQPTGYTLSDVNATSGSVSLEYSAQKINGAQSYTVVQRPTNWDDEKLLTNILSSSRTKVVYNSIEKDGRTVYVYGKNQAAWVSEGVLYQVLGNGALTTQDFGNLAVSM